jgi:hypothetical protein
MRQYVDLSSIRWYFLYLVLRKNISEISHIFVGHDTKDSHHGGSSVLNFNSSLVFLPVVGLLIPSKIQKIISEVTREFGGSCVISVGHFHYDQTHSHLSYNFIGDSVPCSESIRDILKTGNTNTGWWILQLFGS